MSEKIIGFYKKDSIFLASNYGWQYRVFEKNIIPVFTKQELIKELKICANLRGMGKTKILKHLEEWLENKTKV